MHFTVTYESYIIKNILNGNPVNGYQHDNNKQGSINALVILGQPVRDVDIKVILC